MPWRCLSIFSSGGPSSIAAATLFTFFIPSVLVPGDQNDDQQQYPSLDFGGEADGLDHISKNFLRYSGCNSYVS
jgi:hypothetical protein